jgi:hypothetical protein
MSDSSPLQPVSENDINEPLKQTTPELELVDDDITPEQHAEWDEQLKEPYSKSTMIPPEYLLAEIVGTCDKMNQAFEYPRIARQFIQSHPEVAKELENAWNLKQFKRIRLISKLLSLSMFLYLRLRLFQRSCAAKTDPSVFILCATERSQCFL